MIRKLQAADLDTVAALWLETNLTAHPFIPESYWKSHFEGVKAMLPQAEVYVYEQENKILGFIGLNGDYIEGIFVQRAVQSQGIGRQLLDFAKSLKPRLSLSVYQKNFRAVRFYQREGFAIQSEGTDSGTGEKEYLMAWSWQSP